MLSLLRVSRQLAIRHAFRATVIPSSTQRPAHRLFMNSSILTSPTKTTTTTRANAEPAAKKTKAAPKKAAKKKVGEKVVKKKPVKKTVVKKKVVNKPAKPFIDSALKPPAYIFPSFMLFVQDFRSAGTNTYHSTPELGRLAGQAWRALPESEKQVYNDRAKALRAQHEIDLQAWAASVKPADLAYMRKHHKALNIRLSAFKYTTRVKRPMSSFMIFIQDVRNSPTGVKILQDSHMVEVARYAAKLWKELPESEKAPYTEKAALARAQYIVAKEKEDAAIAASS